MELIIIDENKLKIMLTAPDMAHYELHTDRLNCANLATRRAFRHLFSDAREQIGFDTSGERLLVQLYTSRGGGCEIFVTKLGPEDQDAPTVIPPDDPDDLRELIALDGPPAPLDPHTSPEDALLDRLRQEEEAMNQPKSAATARSLSAVPLRTRLVAYRFDTVEDVLAACRRLLNSPTPYRGESAAYISDAPAQGTAYLFLTVKAIPDDPAAAILSEYATPCADPEALSLYLGEYGTTVCAEGAVEVLGAV